MDPISQGVTGAALAVGFATPKQTRPALVAGAVGGMLADLDTLIRSDADPLLLLDFHRHFSHALIFIPIGGLIAALLLWPLLRRRLAFPQLALFTTLGYATAGLLDACTSYGTHLLWPFSDARIAWNVVSIVDPLYTLPMLVLVIWAARQTRPALARAALVFGLAWLALGWVQRERAEAVQVALAAERGHRIERAEVKPTLGNQLLWRSIYRSGGRYYVDAVRVGIGSRTYPGESVAVLEPDRDVPELSAGSVQAADVRRFDHFSDGWLARAPQRADVIGDLRYAMLPTSVDPLWGIVIDPANADRHVRFENFRALGQDGKAAFLAMLSGRDLP